MDIAMNYKMDGRLRGVLLGLMALGAVCLVLTFFDNPDGHHTRFWSAFLLNSLFVTGIAFMGIFFYAICVTAYAGWHVLFKRVWEAFGLFLLVAIVLMGIVTLGLYMDWHHLYHWADPASVSQDHILEHKSSFLNKKNYALFGIGFLAIWYLITLRLRTLSLAEDRADKGDYSYFKRTKVWSAIFLPIGGFSSAAVIWLWLMSIDAHWYSTLFAWYTGASWFVAMIATTILILLYLKGRGHYAHVTSEHLHDLGKFMFAFSIFWTYLWFSQFMLIWYGNVGEETVYFRVRFDEYPVLFYGNLIINFLVPFFILMRNDTKRKVGTLVIVSFVLIFGHWWDFFLMIKPGVNHTMHELMGHAGDHSHAADHAFHMGGMHLPGLLEVGSFLGFMAGLLYFIGGRLASASLVARNDPYLQESLHHHT